MKDLWKKALPAAAMVLMSGVAFAGTQAAISQGTKTSGDIVAQADEPTPDFCKKNPTDARCKK